MQRVDVAWLAIWSVAGVGFYMADRHGVALCASIRRLGRLHTPTGRAASTAAYTTGAVLLWRHVSKR
jgi:hypothetical protein